MLRKDVAAPGRTEGARAEFEQFFARHHAELARLAFLLSGDESTAEDLTADALLAAWERWSRVQEVDQPFAYVRRILVNLAATRVRRLGVERRHNERYGAPGLSVVPAPDPGVSVDVRAALLRLPVRRRACVVMRHVFDLPEAEVAQTLGISLGTVKSQTFKGMAQLAEILGPTAKGGSADERSERRAAARR
jgi:RNA polymerase sigma-70 factor (sigma-E family)